MVRLSRLPARKPSIGVVPPVRRRSETGHVRGTDAAHHAPDPARTADHGSARRRCHSRQQAARSALRPAVSREKRRMGTRGRTSRTRSRRSAGHGRGPDEKFPAPADESRQARLLGGPQAPRRTHSAAASRCRGPARQGDRHQGQNHPPVDGAAHDGYEMRELPSALRSDRPVDGRLRSDWAESGEGSGGPADRQCGAVALRESSPAACPNSGNIWRRIGNRISPGRCATSSSATLWAARSNSPTSRCSTRCRANLQTHDYRLSTLFERVAVSPQFRTQRCRDFPPSRFQSEAQGVEK